MEQGGWLVIKIRPEDTLQIGEGVEIKVESMKRTEVKIAIRAPRDQKVVRIKGPRGGIAQVDKSAK